MRRAIYVLIPAVALMCWSAAQIVDTVDGVLLALLMVSTFNVGMATVGLATAFRGRRSKPVQDPAAPVSS